MTGLDPKTEAAVLISQWEREGVVRARERIAARQLGEAFIGLNLPVTTPRDTACTTV